MRDAGKVAPRRADVVARGWWRRWRAQRKAGASAQALYDRQRKEWLRRNRKVFLLLGLGIAGAVLVLNVLYLRVWHLPWIGGFLSGVGLAGWVAVRQDPPTWIENWQVGAWGEQQTAKELRKLKAPWVVVHDLNAGRGNIDHLVVGPSGVFLLDSKRWAGRVSVRGDQVGVRLWDDGPMKWYEPARHVMSLARETHDRVRRQTRIVGWVQPVVVIWGEFPQGTAGERCAFVSGASLTEWLTSQQQRIADDRVPQIAGAVQRAWQAATPVGRPDSQ